MLVIFSKGVSLVVILAPRGAGLVVPGLGNDGPVSRQAIDMAKINAALLQLIERRFFSLAAVLHLHVVKGVGR